jgi:hypothetical protein
VTEHYGSRYILGQGYTTNYLNGGVTFWNIAGSWDIRHEVYERGRMRFRAVVDDQLALNEVIHTKHYDQLRILPCQYNYRCDIGMKRRKWPSMVHLNGVKIYHNGFCIEAVKHLRPVCATAELPTLEGDGRPLSTIEQIWRRFKRRFQPHIA